MAEVLGLVASCVNIIQGIDAVTKVLRQNVHLGESASKELGLVIGKLSSYRGLIEGIQFQAEFDKASNDRLSALDYINGPLDACKTAVNSLESRVQKLSKHIVFGKLIDKETAASLRCLDETLPILQLALDADQRVLTAEVERYMKTIKEDLSAMKINNEIIHEDVSDLKQMVSSQQTRQQNIDDKAEAQKLKEWITKCDPEEVYEACLKKASAGSGSWFLEHKFDEWIRRGIDQMPRIMWLRGFSGAGKTTLMSLAVEHHRKLQETCQMPILAYFYCSFSVNESQDVINMLGSYVAQMCDQIPGLMDEVRSLQTEFQSRKISDSKRPSIEGLEKILNSACAMVPKLVLYLDAPNESDTSEEMLESFSRLICGNKNLQLFVSSTQDLHLNNLLQNYSQISTIEMESGKVYDDICSYIDERIQQERRLRRLPHDLQNMIRDILSNAAHGSFRWAECQLVALVENTKSEADIKNSLKAISPGLEGLYTTALLTTRSSDSHYLKAALLWLTFAVRPLHLAELSEAMMFRSGTLSLDPTQRLFLDEAEDVLRSCRMLISYNADSRYATLAHSSVRQYLLSDLHRSGPAGFFQFDRSEDFCMLSCLSIEYLNMACFASGYCASPKDVLERRREWPLLKYISFTWPIFMKVMPWPSSDTRKRTEAALLKFFQSSKRPRGGNFGSWIQIYLPRHLNLNQSLSHPLYYAARAGMTEVVRIILRVEGKSKLEIRGGSRESTPLHVACAYGQIETVQLLLEEGADPNESNVFGERGIEWAQVNEDSEVVELLLHYGASPVQQEGINRIEKWLNERFMKPNKR